MALPDPGTISFDTANAANAEQTEKLGGYEAAYNTYTQAAINLQQAQDAFDAATAAAQAALDEYSISLGIYNNEAENIGASPVGGVPPVPAGKKLPSPTGLRK